MDTRGERLDGLVHHSDRGCQGGCDGTPISGPLRVGVVHGLNPASTTPQDAMRGLGMGQGCRRFRSRAPIELGTQQGEPAKRRVGSIGVVLDPPRLDHDRGLEKGGELLDVQQLVSGSNQIDGRTGTDLLSGQSEMP